MKDRIPGELQHYYKMCCEKGGLVWFEGGFTVGTLFPDRWTCIWQETKRKIKVDVLDYVTKRVLSMKCNDRR